MNSVILVIFTCCCVIVNGFTVYDRRKPQDDLNPQLWASHSEAFNHPLEFHQHKPTQAVAALPQLLEENPRAEGVFKNLEFFANPQFKIQWNEKVKKVIDQDLPFTDNHQSKIDKFDRDLLGSRRS